MKFDPTPLIRPNFHGPLVAVLTGFHCNSILQNRLVAMLLWIDAFLNSMILFQLLSIEFCHRYHPCLGGVKVHNKATYSRIRYLSAIT